MADLKGERARIDSVAARGSASAAQQVVSGSASAARRRALPRRADGLPTADSAESDSPAAAALDAMQIAREPLATPCHLASPPLPHALVVFPFPSASSLQPASRGWASRGVAQPGVVEALPGFQKRRWESEGTAGVAPVAPALRAESSEPSDPLPCSALDSEYPRHATCSAVPQQAVGPPIPLPQFPPPLAAFPHCLAQIARAHRSAHPRLAGMGAAERGGAGTIAGVLQQLAERRAAQVGQAEECSTERRAWPRRACGAVTAVQGGEGDGSGRAEGWVEALDAVVLARSERTNGSDVLDEPISTPRDTGAAAATGAGGVCRAWEGEHASEALADAWLGCSPEPPGTGMPVGALITSMWGGGGKPWLMDT
ncbi:unnamed protein product [Closterium sp. Yama58-4]|nr:unnamed protein product [Closterium sp. Yama58-4]